MEGRGHYSLVDGHGDGDGEETIRVLSAAVHGAPRRMGVGPLPGFHGPRRHRVVVAGGVLPAEW